ncbi:PKS-ER domain-containing protein [Mycena sanguinolenta]|uniref:PKS-ER domain-containing protein n=1 Tax=Mycena sanguinolenta TaxID=230812 RepID=A0A8H6Z408_9AGAR|nr:PKS-ER domain-containing protein [Mycena sanguinolenta]
MAKHNAIAAVAKGQFEAVQVETEKPGAGEVLVKVAYASMVTFDTSLNDLGFGVLEYPAIFGLNAAGTVAELGPDVSSLVVGDRVTALQTYKHGGRRGTMQEYVVLPAFQCAKVPDSVTLDSAATVPDNCITAFYALFDQLSLPVPITFPVSTPPSNHATPVLVYGAGSTSGQYALQVLHAAGYTNVVATASPKHHAFLRTLGATHVFDYASPTLSADIARAVGGDGKIPLALDAISAEGTIARIAKILSPQGTAAFLLPIKSGDNVTAGEAPLYWEIPADRNPFPPYHHTQICSDLRLCGGALWFLHAKRLEFILFQNEYLKENLMPKILPELLASGVIQPNRVRLLDQGTFKERVGTGLVLLRDNKINGEKVVVKVA